MELEILRAIQSISCGFLDVFFEGISFLAEKYFIIVLLLGIYWIVGKEFGEYLAYSVLTGMTLNNGLKSAFNLPRPIGEEGIRTLREETATGQSFPSGHSQASSSLSWSIAAYIKKKWMYVIAVVYPLLVAFSRMYLGVHYPKDVLAGVLEGLAVSYLCLWLYKKVRNKLLLYCITFAAMLPFCFFGVNDDFVKACGMYLGFIVAIWIDKKFINYDTNVPYRARFIRFGLGLAVTGATYGLLKLVMPDMLIFDFLRYFLLIVVVLGLVPFTFKKIK